MIEQLLAYQNADASLKEIEKTGVNNYTKETITFTGTYDVGAIPLFIILAAIILLTKCFSAAKAFLPHREF